MEHHFGYIADGQMVLSELGKIAQTCWQAIPDHFPFVKLDAYIIMPNHVHGIIIVDKLGTQHTDAQTQETHNVQTQNIASLRPHNTFGPQSGNLASIIRGFKIGVTKQARIILPEFAWQPRYHDHIIRNEESWDRIANYIVNNPASWKQDKFFL
ncbi:MAG: hypothetical protein AAF696_39145 [Bacteroidota bacterium]